MGEAGYRPPSTYRFARVEGMPETVGYGPAQEVRVRATDRLVGYVRRILTPQGPGLGWVVYSPSGAEVAVADQRNTAANFLRRNYENPTP